MVSSKNNKLDYSSVPTNAELENDTNKKKYTVNRTPRGDLVISKVICALFVILAMMLIAAAALLTYFLLLPQCSQQTTPPEALTEASLARSKSSVSQRLSRSLEPTLYRIRIIPFLQGENFTTDGHVQITIDVKEPTGQIELNINDIKIDDDSVTVRRVDDQSSIDIGYLKFDDESQKYRINLGGYLKEGESILLDIKFKGNINNFMQGFYRSSYIDSQTSQNRWMASTQFSPTDARRAFPCFDEPSFKAKYVISIARPPYLRSLSNMPKKGTEKMKEIDNWEWDHYFETSHQMSSYLVAFVVSDLLPVLSDTSDKNFMIWARKDVLPKTEYAMTIGPKLLKFYNNYFGINYSLPKIDMMAVPDFGFKAMENWGLITFRESILLFDESDSSVEDKRTTAKVIAHELAHQWFGNLVTPEWWEDLWLKEGFANYFLYKGVNSVEPSWDIEIEFVFSEMYEAFKIDSLKSAHPLSHKVNTMEEIRQLFDPISYSKGASIIKMMNDIMGESNFIRGWKNYLNTFKYSNAKRSDLWKIMEQEVKNGGNSTDSLPLADIMESWTIQPGFPVITAVRNGSRVDVSQKRFSYDMSIRDNSLWWVPLSYTTDKSINTDYSVKPKRWLKKDTGINFQVDADRWWLLNLNQTGYYIVNYDEENWRELTKNLMSFNKITRAQLINDAMDLARAGILDYDIALKIVEENCVNDGQLIFGPLQVAFDKLEYLYNVLYLTPTFGSFEKFLTNIFTIPFNAIKLSDKGVPDTYIVQRIRKLVFKWNCKIPESECEVSSKRTFRSLLTGKTPEIKITANNKEIIYCTSVREGGEYEWDFLYHKYKLPETSVGEKETILNALGCTEIPWLLARYLNDLIKNNSWIRKQDGNTVFKAVASNPVGHGIAFNFLKENWKQINDYYGTAFNTISKMVEEIATFITTESQYEELLKFKKNSGEYLDVTEQAFNNVLEKAKNNIKWMKMNYNTVEKWLRDYRAI